MAYGQGNLENFHMTLTSQLFQATPHLMSKRKSLHGRKLRPKSVVDSVDGLSADDIPDLLPSLTKSAQGIHLSLFSKSVAFA